MFRCRIHGPTWVHQTGSPDPERWPTDAEGFCVVCLKCVADLPGNPFQVMQISAEELSDAKARGRS